MKKLEKQIHSFAGNFLLYLSKRNISSAVESNRYEDVIQSVDLGRGFSLRFLTRWGGKRFYLTLYKGSKYRLELLLCRILFGNDGTVLWYLDTPSRPENKVIYDDLFKKRVDIPRRISEAIKKQQESLHEDRKFNYVNSGYLIGNSILPKNVFQKLEKIILRVMDENTSEEETNIAVLEGIAREYTRLQRSRSRKYIEPAKKRDKYTCQACGLKLSVDGKRILQVHHLNPLHKEAMTTLDDLTSLCPTCHYIAHRRMPPYTPNEIKQLLLKE